MLRQCWPYQLQLFLAEERVKCWSASIQMQIATPSQSSNSDSYEWRQRGGTAPRSNFLKDRFRCTSANSGESPSSSLRPKVDIRTCAKTDVYADLIVWPNF
jgi:hypothetical protein